MASEFLNFIFALVIIILAAKTGGYLSTRLGQPAVLGELLAGLLLGPTALDLLHSPLFETAEHLGETITLMAELGVILLMFLAGLELHLSELLQAGKTSAVAGILGVVLPLGLGYGTAILFDAPVQEALFIGLALSATSVSISAQTLLELNVLRTRVGLALLGAAVFDDILVILILSISLILVTDTGGGLTSIVITILQMVGYIVIASLLGLFVLPKIISWVSRLRISQGLLAFALVTCLLYSWAAEQLGGVAAITGAFLLGLFIARTPFKDDLEDGVAAMAYAFFVPIFFVNIGLEVNLTAITGNGWIFAILLTIVAVVSKIVGSGGGALATGFSRKESLQLGIGMVSRGEVGLIVAAFALNESLIGQDNFSIVIFMVIIATVVTPPLLRFSFANQEVKTQA